MGVKYSIIIPTYNHCDDLLKPCIESIIKYTNLDEVEIIISANGCTDNTRDYISELIKQYPYVFKLVWNDNPVGYAKANNEAIRIAKAEKIVLLNNDTILLDQKKNVWLELLDAPFKKLTTGISCVSKTFSFETNRDFAIFFCVMIHKKVFEKIGLLNEEYGVGGGEDTEFCFEAEEAGFWVEECTEKYWSERNNLFVGGFPIYHKGEGTVHDTSLVPKWDSIFRANSLRLAKKYNKDCYRYLLSNNFERAVFLKDDTVFPRETTRYKWAAAHLKGNKILDVGCTTGYGYQFLPNNIDYIGVDYDPTIVDVAKSQDWGENVSFRCENIMDILDPEKIKSFGRYDTIIAFEVIEHLDKPIEVVNTLKRMCDRLLITVPYKEPKGFWGEHHKLHDINETFFPDSKIMYMNEEGDLGDKPFDGIVNLMLVEMNGDSTAQYGISKNMEILCSVSTKGRYYSTLPLALTAIANQSKKPNHLVIFDDNEDVIDLRTSPMYQNIFKLFDLNGISWEVIYGEKRGQHYNHQRANTLGYKWVWRVDDDCIPNGNALETLSSYCDDSIGCIGGSVLTHGINVDITNIEGTIDEVLSNKPNIQWGNITELKNVQHLHCTFLYRAGVCDYNLSLSPAAHREETMFSYEFFKKGYKNIVVPNAITYHLKDTSGGIRAYNSSYFEYDDKIFKNSFNSQFIAVLDNGIGDHIVFRSLLNDLRKKHDDITIACCYPEVFRDDSDIKLISIADAKTLTNIDELNIYKKMVDWNWNDSLENAFRKLYL